MKGTRDLAGNMGVLSAMDKSFLGFSANLAIMIRFLTISLCILSSVWVLPACQSGSGGFDDRYVFTPRPGQGRYVQPANLRPLPTQPIQLADLCRANFYKGLEGQHEGAIYFVGLPGAVRVIKPAFLEGFENDFLPDTLPRAPLLEVRDYIPDQILYAPTIRTVDSVLNAGPVIRERLTVELDVEGYVQDVRCG